MHIRPSVIWGLVMFGITLMASEAGAGGPSFDCKRASGDDERAICNNVVLSANDLETTRLFNKLREIDRKRAVTIAKSFLRVRRACKSASPCIAEAQAGAMVEFNKAISGSEETNSTQTGTPTVVDNSNPWPDAYSRRDYKLGISLSAFRAAPYPDRSTVVDYRVGCTNDDPSRSADHFGGELYDKRFVNAGVILCRHYGKIANTAGFSNAGLGMADLQLQTEFYFIPDVAGTHRLFWIITYGPADQFSRLAGIMQTAYGTPSYRTEIWQNKIGNTFTNEVLTWSNASSEIEIRHFADEITKLRVEHRLKVLHSQLGSIFATEDAAAAKKL